MVDYVFGRTKKPVRSSERDNNDSVAVKRISRDDVERLSRGQSSNRRGYGSRNVPHRLNEQEREELERAARKGYLTLSGGGNRRTRKGSPLKNIHRQWCDSRDRPQILLYKAVGGKAVDEVVIDLSPLRLNGVFEDPVVVGEALLRWTSQMSSEAYKTGMELRESYDDDCDAFSPLQDIVVDDDKDSDCVVEVDMTKRYTMSTDAMNQEAWARNPIWQLPVVSVGVFEGERSMAKSMASTLAQLWDIPEIVTVNDASARFDSSTTELGPKSRRASGDRHGGHTKMKGLTEHRKRGGGHRQAW
jgi:hypothetical protein